MVLAIVAVFVAGTLFAYMDVAGGDGNETWHLCRLVSRGLLYTTLLVQAGVSIPVFAMVVFGYYCYTKALGFTLNYFTVYLWDNYRIPVLSRVFGKSSPSDRREW
uniref:Uncharacterized protein n=1 Tax=viral metagenome TaxID=1070528 RepID=A0A6M3K2N6_9ZZZZ